MIADFYIKENRLRELKTFIGEFTPTVRFNHNPIKIDNEFNVSITMSVEDGNKLNKLRAKWYYEDNPVKTKNNIWNIFLSKLNKKIKK